MHESIQVGHFIAATLITLWNAACPAVNNRGYDLQASLPEVDLNVRGPAVPDNRDSAFEHSRGTAVEQGGAASPSQGGEERAQDAAALSVPCGSSEDVPVTFPSNLKTEPLLLVARTMKSSCIGTATSIAFH